MPRPLVKPTPTPGTPRNLVSLIIQDSAANNISIPANKAKLENNLGSYYKDKKQLPVSTVVVATVSTCVVLLQSFCTEGAKIWR